MYAERFVLKTQVYLKSVYVCVFVCVDLQEGLEKCVDRLTTPDIDDSTRVVVSSIVSVLKRSIRSPVAFSSNRVVQR